MLEEQLSLYNIGESSDKASFYPVMFELHCNLWDDVSDSEIISYPDVTNNSQGA